MCQATNWYDANNTKIIMVCGAIVLLACLKHDMQSQSYRNTAIPCHWTYQVNLDTATTRELENLPQIGPAMAQRIVEFRSHLPNKKFAQINQLQHIRGIGNKTFNTIAPFLVLSQPE
ncbi:MAG: helix-hairpin-helix domain-containing protein [Planctomycetota bacterium]|nr:helix-hairpin-helix domain-containing protein [Planctomycetota bacterium]